MDTNAYSLNDYLFQQLDILTNDDLKDEELEDALKRSKAVCEVTKAIVDNNRTILDAVKIQNEYGGRQIGLRGMIGVIDE